jgi:hypothetical protein
MSLHIFLRDFETFLLAKAGMDHLALLEVRSTFNFYDSIAKNSPFYPWIRALDVRFHGAAGSRYRRRSRL